MQRDRDNEKELKYLEWTVIRFWGNDIIKHTDDCVEVIEELILLHKIKKDDYLIEVFR